MRAALVLITNRKSHTVFRLVPTSVTLNDPERRNSRFAIAVIPPNPIAVRAYYATVIEDRPILSAEYPLPFLAKSAPRNSGTVSLRQPSYMF